MKVGSGLRAKGSRHRADQGRRADDLEVPQLPAVYVERDAFAYGCCDRCDWEGPARRARRVAESDAELHRLAGCQLPRHVEAQTPVPPAVPVPTQVHPTPIG